MAVAAALDHQGAVLVVDGIPATLTEGSGQLVSGIVLGFTRS